jgi:hypothetical protein
MSSRKLLSLIIGLMLMIAVISLSVMLPKQPDSAPVPANYYVGSDWIERHPENPLPDNFYAGSDWIERHPINPLPANYYTGSDWVERHPINPLPANYYAGSDWVERHSKDLFEAAEWAKPVTQPSE